MLILEQVRSIQIILILALFSILLFPGATGFSAFSVLDIDERGISIPVSEEDEDGFIGLDQRDSVQIGEEEEELVELTNNLDFEVESEVDLDDNINWNTVGDPIRTLESGDIEIYNVDMTDVSENREEGNYIVRFTEGSFLIEAERVIDFDPPAAKISIGGQSDEFVQTESSGEYTVEFDGEQIFDGDYDPARGDCEGISDFGACDSDVWSDNPDSLEIDRDGGRGSAIIAEVGQQGTGTVYIEDPDTGQRDTISFTIVESTPLLEVEFMNTPNVQEGDNTSPTVEITNIGDDGVTDVEVFVPDLGDRNDIKEVSLDSDETIEEQFNIDTEEGDTRSDAYEIIVESRTDESVIDTFDRDESMFRILDEGEGISIENVEVSSGFGDGESYEGEDVIFTVDLKNDGEEDRTEDISLNSLREDSKQVTVESEDTKTIDLGFGTFVGESREEPYTYSVSSQIDNFEDEFELLRVRPTISSDFLIIDSNSGQDRFTLSDTDGDAQDVVEQLGGQKEIERIELTLIVNGNEEETILLVENGNVQDGAFDQGDVTADGESYSLSGGVRVSAQDTDFRGGDNLEVDIKVIDDQGESVEETYVED